MDIWKIKYSEGLYSHPLYQVWFKAKQRCYNPNNHAYKYYGAKGVIMCDLWKNDFEAFYNWAITNGYAKGLTLERKETSGNYEPDNCTFKTQSEQNKNRSNALMYELNGEKKTLVQWCAEFNVSRRMVYQRLRIGWTLEDAIKEPKQSKLIPASGK